MKEQSNQLKEIRFLFLVNELESNVAIGDPLYIVNPEADSESYVEDKFKIDQLEKLSDDSATFNLISGFSILS